MVPVRAIFESVDAEVEWDAETKTVIINTKKVDDSVSDNADYTETTEVTTEATTEVLEFVSSADEGWIDFLLEEDLKPEDIKSSNFKEDEE